MRSVLLPLAFFDCLANQATDLPPGQQPALRGLELALDPAFSILNTAFQVPGLSFSSLTDIGNTFANTGFWLGSFLMKLLIVAFILFSGLVYIAMYIISMVLLYVAAALGPVMIPWVLFGPMSFLFDGWVRFVIGASLYKVVGLVMIAVSGALYDPLMQASRAAAAGGSQYFNFTAASAALLISGVMALLMLQIPMIANGLASGIARTGFSFRSAATARINAAAGRTLIGTAGTAIRTAAAAPAGAVIRGAHAAASSSGTARAAALVQRVGGWRPLRELAATYRAGRDALTKSGPGR
jgi:type IV secretory pathway VirB6-like protein